MAELRWVRIASSIRNSIRRGELVEGARLASELEMAKNWNVSAVTVHRALSELQREGWVVRRRRAGTVVADRSETPAAKIALVFAGLLGPPQAHYLHGIEESLADRYQLIPMNTQEDRHVEKRRLEQAAAECCAVICYPTGAPQNGPLLSRIAASMPLVLVDRTIDGVEADAVVTDNFGSMTMGLMHLRGLGHARIAYVMEDNRTITSGRDRFNAYIEFIKREFGGPPADRWVLEVRAHTIPFEECIGDIENALVNLLDCPEPITAIVCLNDTMMFMVIDACIHLNIRIPDDIAVLSFSDVDYHTPLCESVHRLVQRKVEMGHIAAQTIQQRLSALPGFAVRKVEIMTDLRPARPHFMSSGAVRFAERHLKLIELNKK